uniref:Uncharacterized protein n=1 Tax=Arundo donax TaxID=35708 RepID=A0A0A9HSE0_ARUDO
MHTAHVTLMDNVMPEQGTLFLFVLHLTIFASLICDVCIC